MGYAYQISRSENISTRVGAAQREIAANQRFVDDFAAADVCFVRIHAVVLAAE